MGAVGVNTCDFYEKLVLNVFIEEAFSGAAAGCGGAGCATTGYFLTYCWLPPPLELGSKDGWNVCVLVGWNYFCWYCCCPVTG